MGYEPGTASLSLAQISAYKSYGFAFPIRSLSEASAAANLEQFERFEAAGHTRDRDPRVLFKPHLCFMWMFHLATNPVILDAIEELIGPNILLYGSQAWNKLPNDPRYITWHRDSEYFGLSPNELVTAWTALSEATPENGGMRYLPASHIWPDMKHTETFDPDNLLSRGQRLDGISDEGAVDVVLRPGETSLHHERLVHASGGNSTPHRRLGFTGLYIPTNVASTIGRRSALLVRGVDDHKLWDEDPTPRFDLDPIGLVASALAGEQYKAGRATAAPAI